MAHVRQELALGFVGGFGSLFGCEQLFLCLATEDHHGCGLGQIHEECVVFFIQGVLGEPCQDTGGATIHIM